MSQKLRNEENLRRISRINDSIPGKTSAIPGEKDLPINPDLTQSQWYEQASGSERQVKELTSKGMHYLKGLELEKAKIAFEKVYELKPYTYCWQYGIVLFYLEEYYEAAECFAKNAKIFESRFGSPASEERIWRDACELKIVKNLQNGKYHENNDSGVFVAQIDDAEEGGNYSILEQQTEIRKVVRISRDLFASSIQNDLSNEALARGKLRSICGEYEPNSDEAGNNKVSRNDALTMKVDKKMWRLSSWFYLGLHYDVLGEADASKDCMKMALRQCATSFGNGNDGKCFFLIGMQWNNRCRCCWC